MNQTTQNAFSLAARLLLALLFLPAGIAKLTGFEGTVGYISSAGLPLPEVARRWRSRLKSSADWP